MTVRMATCRELADDRQAVEKLAQFYWNIEKSATPFASLLPWFPGSAKRTKEKATMGLYHLIGSYVKLHRDAPTLSTDPIDVLLADGISDDNILGVSLSHLLHTLDIYLFGRQSYQLYSQELSTLALPVS